MSEYTLLPNTFASVTAAGAFHATTGSTDDPARNLLVALLGLPQTPLLNMEALDQFLPEESNLDVPELLFRMQEIGWIIGKSEQDIAPNLNMERDIPQLLGKLSSENRTLLADSQGFQLVNEGFSHEAVEELSVVAADVAAMQQRHRLLLRNNLRINATGWAAVDAAGNSQIGFWPLQISNQTFVMAVAGVPDFNQPSFSTLIWWLVRRYTDQP